MLVCSMPDKLVNRSLNTSTLYNDRSTSYVVDDDDDNDVDDNTMT